MLAYVIWQGYAKMANRKTHSSPPSRLQLFVLGDNVCPKFEQPVDLLLGEVFEVDAISEPRDPHQPGSNRIAL